LPYNYSIKALIAEDNAMNSYLLEQLLLRWHIGSDTAFTGTAAVEKAQQLRYDIIFMDLQLPQLNGVEAAVRIRTAPSASLHVPIIAMTASIYHEHDIYGNGMNDLISKPFSANEIYKTLLRHIAPLMSVPLELSDNSETATDTVTDLRYLHELSSGNESFTRRMAFVFCSQSPIFIEQMQNAVATNNWAGLRTVAHKMKPTFKMMGVSEGEVLLEYLEIFGYAENTDLSKTKAYIKRIEQLCELAYAELQYLL
jgi:CheY-like chemotaxis protein